MTFDDNVQELETFKKQDDYVSSLSSASVEEQLSDVEVDEQDAASFGESHPAISHLPVRPGAKIVPRLF